MLHDGLDAARRTIISARVPWLIIESDEPLQVNLDGEPIADTHFRFEILPGKLRLKLPPEFALLAKSTASGKAVPH